MSGTFENEGDASVLFGAVVNQEEHDAIAEVLEQHSERHELFRSTRWKKPLGKVVLRNALRHAWQESGSDRPFIEWVKSWPWQSILEWLFKLAPLVL